MSITTIIKSPKATQVKAMHVSNGDTIIENQLLMELFDFEEKKILSSINRGIEENSAKLAEVQGARIRDKQNNLITISEAKLDVLTKYQVIYEARLEQYKVGLVSITEVIKARTDMALKSYQILQATVEAELYQINTNDSISVFATINKLLEAEKAYVQGRIDRLSIRAPRAGRFSTAIAVGSPVRLGHVLGEIT